MVHLFLFKHPQDPKKAFPADGVDALLAGLLVIFKNEHRPVANEKLKSRIEAIKQVIPKAYRVHCVTSGIGIGKEQKTKLDTFVAGIENPNEDFFQWELEDLTKLQQRFYQQNLPAVEDPIVFNVGKTAYLTKSGSAACYLFIVFGDELAKIYEKFGEALLHRNIRAGQGSTPTNRAIKASCTGPKSADFVHFNNGVSILANAHWDPMDNKITLTRSQIVNGGQTVRILHSAYKEGSLKSDVRVAVRVISSGDNSQFGSDVTVNQNNQNSMKTGFLRSNDPSVVQLATSLMSAGWYLERRKGELKSITEDEKRRIEISLNNPLEGRVIPLNEGTQAYVATYFRQPEMAKKNPKKMFQSAEEGGSFEDIFSYEISGEKVVSAVRIRAAVDKFVNEFSKMQNRKKKRNDDDPATDAEYRSFLGDRLVSDFRGDIDQAIPQSAVFLCATIFQEWVDILGKDPLGFDKKGVKVCESLADTLEQNAATTIQRHLATIFQFAKEQPRSIESSWPNMMKSNKFLTQVMAYMRGAHSTKSVGIQTATTISN